MKDLDRPAGYASLEEAADVAAEHAQSPDVEAARSVTFAGNTHVHLDLTDGDIAIIGPDKCLHVVCS